MSLEKIRFFLIEFDGLSNKEKIFLLNDLVRAYPGMVEFAKLSETEKRQWQAAYGDLAKEYFKGAD